MPKTAAPRTVTVPQVGAVHLSAVPDAFDGRDLEYRPRLQPLPVRLDWRDAKGERYVMRQEGNACTGHAVAAVVNTVLARTSGDTAPRVSPYMLYRLARRYDEFPGEEDAGSSLRGCFKGWFHHGVALEETWPLLRMRPEPDPGEREFARACRERPLGAFYRVNPYRLDDMQSAISELNAVAVSGVLHEGWLSPRVLRQGERDLHLIARPVNARALGGHAYALVGYNEVGFLVQNSWGERWGARGFATLPYEDWLETAYDAWVARPGVPSTPFSSGRRQGALGTRGRLVSAPGPDLRRLAAHVVNLGNEGRLSAQGRFVSSPAQVERLFEHMGERHAHWLEHGRADCRHVLLYAHGGLVSEADGLDLAQKHLNWWLNNGVYPVYFAWQSGPVETLVNHLTDRLQERLPAGGLGFDLVEQFDRLVEGVARTTLAWMWDEMKENARAASLPLRRAVTWPLTSSAAQDALAALPGASLVVDRLGRYREEHGPENVAVHLVGHSAGSIFHAALLERLLAAGIPAESLTLLAPALRVDEFRRRVLPHLGDPARVGRFATFAMSDERELDDTCSYGGLTGYHKSLLYLVSRALERPGRGDRGEVPLLGMQRFAQMEPDGGGPTLLEEIEARGGAYVTSPSAEPDDARSDATTHGGFDDDAPTMTSVLMHVLNVRAATARMGYQRDAALDDVLAVGARAAGGDGEAEVLRAASPLPVTSTVGAPSQVPLGQTAEPRERRPLPPPSRFPLLEVRDAPRTGFPILDLLESEGWREGPPAP
ncbi:C1 family peptidase [Deinococcus aestuarii]|uniref:C1 family peptidase n=1 Tax=Deinococcus aestuarii TaxID=2774531 RepID=UPI001C0DC35D|nr:C1 family peptidase [Deinococcus aestuarii]